MNISLFLETVSDSRSALSRKPETRASPALASVQSFKSQLGSEDATSVKLSTSERALTRGSERALRSLNEATSYVSIAQSATENIGLLVDKALQIAQTLETAVPADVRESLAQEGQDILAEIDTIVDEATFNGIEVIAGGSQLFTVNLDAADESFASSYAVHVQNVAVSRNELSLSTLSASSFSNSATQTVATLELAQLAVESTLSNLQDSEQEIENAASHFGLTASVQASVPAGRGDTNPTPEQLASEISSVLGNTLREASHNLNPLRVQDLLAPIEDISSSEETDSSTAASTSGSESEER